MGLGLHLGPHFSCRPPESGIREVPRSAFNLLGLQAPLGFLLPIAAALPGGLEPKAFSGLPFSPSLRLLKEQKEKESKIVSLIAEQAEEK